MAYKSGQIFLPFCYNSRVWRTDGQTDGRTDRILITIPRLHYMQRGNKTEKCDIWLCCLLLLYSSIPRCFRCEDDFCFIFTSISGNFSFLFHFCCKPS